MDSVAEHLKHAAKTAVNHFTPKLAYEFRMERLLRTFHAEAELALLSRYCHRDKISIDVGANEGMYTYVMARYSRAAVAFEPNPVLAASLSAALSGRASVYPYALSDHRGEALLRWPSAAKGQATIEPDNSLSRDAEDEVVQVSVETRLLDDFDLRDVAVIKIDVEGHEDAVIRGALATIRRERPLLIVEVEDRHRAGATAEVQRLMEDIGYRGWFLEGTAFQTVDTFDLDVHQNLSNLSSDGSYKLGRYLNNFVFLPDGAPPPSPLLPEDYAGLKTRSSFAGLLAAAFPALVRPKPSNSPR